MLGLHPRGRGFKSPSVHHKSIEILSQLQNNDKKPMKTFHSFFVKKNYLVLVGTSMMAFRAFASLRALVICAALSPETMLSAFVFDTPSVTIFETSATLSWALLFGILIKI